MATVNEITSAAGYTGSAQLGGGLGIGVTLDVTPMQRLANFTYYRDRDVWELKQKQDAEAAKAIANIAAFDIASPLTPYSNSLKSQLEDIQTFVRDNPDALVYSRNPKKFTLLNEKINKFSTLRQSATASDAVFNARKAAIDKEPDARKREVLRKELDLDVADHFKPGIDKTIGVTLKSAPELKLEEFQLPTPKITEYTVLDEAPDGTIRNKFKFQNLTQLKADSELLAAGLGSIDEDAPWFKALSPERKVIEREKRGITAEQRQKIKKLSTDFNNLLTMYKQANPNVNLATITGASTGDTLLDNVKWANSINDQIDQLNALIKGGTLKDPTGRVITEQFEKFNLEDGLSEAEILMMQGIQKSATPLWSLDKEVVSNDNAIQRKKIQLDEAQSKRANGLGWFNAETDRLRLGMKKDANGNWIFVGANTAEIKTSGNAFDEIGGTEEIVIADIKSNAPTGDKIIDGIVYDKAGHKKTGKVTVTLSAIPANMVAALKSAGTDLQGVEEFELVVKDGQINSIKPEDGNPVSRQAMENAQKKFDTERKGAEPLNWGRTLDKPIKATVNVPGL